MKNSAVAEMIVGTTQRRSLGRSAGRKKARTCQMIIGQHMTIETLKAMEKRTLKPPSAVMT